eukprot:jgi/Tetstr1/432509/TSEL_021883.t1
MNAADKKQSDADKKRKRPVKKRRESLGGLGGDGGGRLACDGTVSGRTLVQGLWIGPRSGAKPSVPPTCDASGPPPLLAILDCVIVCSVARLDCRTMSVRTLEKTSWCHRIRSWTAVAQLPEPLPTTNSRLAKRETHPGLSRGASRA